MIKAELFTLPVFVLERVDLQPFHLANRAGAQQRVPGCQRLLGTTRLPPGAVYEQHSSRGGAWPVQMKRFTGAICSIGLGLALAIYFVLRFFSLPILFFYGVIRGLDQSTPDVIVPQFVGALFGRYYFEKKFGRKDWPNYRVVFFAGYGCGVGLVMMLSLGLVFMSKSVFQSNF